MGTAQMQLKKDCMRFFQKNNFMDTDKKDEIIGEVVNFDRLKEIILLQGNGMSMNDVVDEIRGMMRKVIDEADKTLIQQSALTGIELAEISALIKLPVRFDEMGGYFWDADDRMIAQVRGWGRLQYLPDAEKKQDNIGKFIAEAINTKLKNI